MLGLGWALDPMIGIFYKRKERRLVHTDRDTGEEAV